MILDRKHGFYTPNYLYYASTTEYLGATHFPYFLLAGVCLSTFTVLPIILLCLYPCLWFQNCLNNYRLSCHALHIFMDAFQGSYKNGTNGTKDYRYFAGGNLLLMVAVYSSLIFQMIFMKYWVTVLVVAVFLGAFSICRPFKEDRHNNLHIMWLLLVLFVYSVIFPFQLQHEQADTYIGSILCVGFVSIPPLCVAYVGIRLISSSLKRLKHYVLNKWGCCQRQEQGQGDETDETPLLNEDRVMYTAP